MFNAQLGQALFEILPSEVSSSIAYQDSRCTETRKNHALDHGNGLLYEALRHGMASTRLDT
jgi:CRISPR/Cas system-associated endonuclease Cas1